MADQTFIEFIIDLTVDYYQKPKEERIRQREERKRNLHSPYSHKWFGMLPTMLKEIKNDCRKKS